jgi:hypothetical protein
MRAHTIPVTIRVAVVACIARHIADRYCMFRKVHSVEVASILAAPIPRHRRTFLL